VCDIKILKVLLEMQRNKWSAMQFSAMPTRTILARRQVPGEAPRGVIGTERKP